jgi:hypothetical protein
LTPQSASVQEVAYRAGRTEDAAGGSDQINDVFVDDRGLVFAVDRLRAALHFEMTPDVNFSRAPYSADPPPAGCCDSHRLSRQDHTDQPFAQAP